MESGRAQPVTILSPVHRWWALWLRILWPLARAQQRVGRLLGSSGLSKRLPVIHFAHWALVLRLPPSGRGGAARPLRPPYVLFQSNFNGEVGPYIDAFSILMPWRMRLLWGGAYGFPGPHPVGPFRGYILDRALTADHFFHAYPDASVRMVRNALSVRRGIHQLAREAEGATPEQFARRWHKMVCDLQAAL